jgi:hypothetical protein
MGITAEVSSVIQNSKEQFEKAMTTSLAANTLKNIVLRGVPAEDSEIKRMNDPKFRESFNRILNPITANIIDKFQSVGQFDTGNLFTSMVTSIVDSVSLESAYRAESLESKFLLDKIPITASREWVGEIKKAFESLEFSHEDIKSRFNQNIKYILSIEAGDKVIKDIKDEVKKSIDETDGKNELVEGTLQEIADYKKEVSPPDDEYVDADNPDDREAANGDKEDENKEIEGEETSSVEEDTADDDINSGVSLEENTEGDENPELNSEGEKEIHDEALDDENLNTEDPTPVETASVSTGKQANVIININASNESLNSRKHEKVPFTDKSFKNAKSLLLLHTAESFASAFIPMHDRDINDMDLPDIKTMASEGVNAIGNIKKEVEIRLASARYAIDKCTESQEDKNILYEKLNKLTAISNEALNLVDSWSQSMYKLGITQDRLLNSNESTLFIARNIISRFLTKTKVPNAIPLQYTSQENILANAFDIVQLRQMLHNQENPLKGAVDDLISRENLFYHNIVSMNDKETKEKATAIIDLTAMIFQKALTANFITDYKIKTWEMNVGRDQKDTNVEIISRVEKRFEELWQRPLNADEKAIVSATTNNEDVTEIIPTPYEKFLIKLSKESMFDKSIEDNEPIRPLSPEENKNNRFKAKIFTSLFKSLEHFNLIDKSDLMEVNKFYNSINPALLFDSID